MKNILKNAENAEKLLELTSDTMILLDRNGICVDIAVHNADLWFLKENQLLGRNILQLLPSVTYRQVYPEFKKVLAYKEVSARNYELTIGSETYFFKCIMRPYEIWCSANTATSPNVASANGNWKRKTTNLMKYRKPPSSEDGNTTPAGNASTTPVTPV